MTDDKNDAENPLNIEKEKVRKMEEKIKVFLIETRHRKSVSRKKSTYSHAKKSVLDPYRTQLSLLRKNGATLSEILTYLHHEARPRLVQKISRSTISRFIQKMEKPHGF